MSVNIDKLVADRDSRYGHFSAQAAATEIMQEILIHHLDNNKRFLALDRTTRAQIKQAVKMIACKLARAVCGDPAFPDNPIDIGGYALLWERALASPLVHVGSVNVFNDKLDIAVKEEAAKRRQYTGCTYCGAAEGDLHREGCRMYKQQDKPRPDI